MSNYSLLLWDIEHFSSNSVACCTDSLSLDHNLYYPPTEGILAVIISCNCNIGDQKALKNVSTWNVGVSCYVQFQNLPIIIIHLLDASNHVTYVIGSIDVHTSIFWKFRGECEVSLLSPNSSFMVGTKYLSWILCVYCVICVFWFAVVTTTKLFNTSIGAHWIL